MIRIIFFDFDGTLTSRVDPETTWEKIWVKLGYDIRECQILHEKYNSNELTREKWFEITQQKFVEQGLNKKDVIQIASGMELIKGIRKVFYELHQRQILIYIVSGAVLEIIENVLGDLCQFVSQIQANKFMYDESGNLKTIISTKYDFQGKARFINQVLEEKNISPNNAVFVGNSENDRFVYESGVKTICVNPDKTTGKDRKVWGHTIERCDDLTDIYRYIFK